MRSHFVDENRIEELEAELARVTAENEELRAADRVHASARAGFEARANARADEAERRLAEAIEWRPIETAPKNGTPVLVVRAEEGDIEITEWCSVKQSHFEDAGSGLFRKVDDEPYEFWNGNGHRATHWMPLPKPPAALSPEQP